ncbi:Rrf2 family transcriptional regulator [Anaerovorax odorimutans]|uniref:Rrf2 family transcriptional regulator n=1 Tax=Anaerovorax odorimutans TaxID=109327 RepID=A0ABT1RJ15_9FIRM|nr:Rrf2 family transcriptional regulator [Anaerovorax odorimutans]MCQ4635172.1 Rrf2 family transcriptional regulator [Anaerovorax odorimutans]
MQLKLTTDYAIRTVLYLAENDRIVASSEIAEKMAIPRKYLINIIGTIKKAGLIDTHKGQQGGYSLKLPPEEISLYDIIRAMEGEIAFNRCMESDGFCSRNAAAYCPVHSVYEEAQEKIIGYFKNINVKNLINR